MIAVYGTQGSPADTAALKAHAIATANDLFAQIKLAVTIVADSEVEWSAVNGSSLLLYGGPALNVVSSQVMSQPSAASPCGISSTLRTAISLTDNDSVIHIGPEAYSHPDMGLAAFGSVNISCTGGTSQPSVLSQLYDVMGAPPVPFVSVAGQSLVLMFAGSSVAGIANAIAQSDLGQSNSILPDYIVTSRACAWKGAGGLAAAGFWSNSWQWKPELSYSTRPVE